MRSIVREKTWNKSIACVLAAVLLLGTVALGVSLASPMAADEEASLRLWYDEPASQTNSSDTWQEATLPIGNGRLGANVYGELSQEHLTLNEETLWSGGRGSVDDYNGGNPSSSMVGTYNGYANTLLSGGSLSSIEGLAGVSEGVSGYNDGYQALGDLHFNFTGAPTSTPDDYSRELNLDTGVSTVSYTYNGVKYTRTYFVSNDPNVIVAHFAADGGTLSFTTSMTSKQSGTPSASVESRIGYITCPGTVLRMQGARHLWCLSLGVVC